MEILIVTGLSGSGKTQALNAIEDTGYFCMDNLPPQLLPKFCEMALSSEYKNKVAAVVDLRSGKFFDHFMATIRELKEMGIMTKILFLYADQEVIIGRYKELRRPHPLNKSIVKGYQMEQELLEEVKNIADYVIDTSDFSSKDLKNYVIKLLSGVKNSRITIVITSFGYKKEILRDGDLIFDVRFLPNPFYIKELKELDGLQEKTKNYVLSSPITKTFLEKSIDLLEFLIPNYEKEGKRILTIGFGCTGGFHRSVVISEEVGRILREAGHSVYISHRDREVGLWKKR
ncbi:MAG: RNase adapter RapZ [Tissierellia bacterium]|nr:RNase adapter RapZ [Tissierellia bacterium]